VHIRLLRPLNLFISALTVFMIAHALGYLGNWILVLIAMAVVLSYNAAGNALNDYMDYESDAVNRPDRPISSGKVNRRAALIMSIVLFGIGTVCAFSLLFEAKVVAIGIALPLLVLYSLRLKKLPLIGNVTVSLLLGLTFIFCGYVFDGFQHILIPAALAFGLTLVRELVKDISDMEGDKNALMQTFPIMAGLRNAVSLSVFLAMVTGLGALLPYWFGIYGNIYLIILVFGVEIPMMTSVALLVNNPAISTAIRSARILKFSTIMGLSALYFGMLYAI